ncbi:Phosphotransferase enzyme family protein [Treponema bryantii]|uniref:Phosphotransferase enzyme family protein n=2 Tax=Treponema bryantii TaxID=163 RepID=A0A1H9D2B0_9SPIR|nr:Phosphotransferase enzyme family protein [Treponema bryantii]
MDIKKYLSGNKVSEIRVGQSGANVYEINGEQILKHVQRDMLKNDMFDTYQKEALFYQSKMNTSSEYLPEILSVELSDDEIIILMKKYVSLERSNSDGELQKIINTLAKIHNDKIPEFLKKNRKEPLDKERVDYCLNGWRSVLNEHPKVFDEESLNPIAEKINEIICWHNNEDRVLIHGDFHWDNLLKTDDGRICVCDWQNVAIGGASEDLSFFMSRLGADGIQIDLDKILNMYTNAVKEISGKVINPELIKKHIAASNVITTFEFWHEFLHGNPEDRVKGIFDKLIKDFQTVNTSCTSSM